MDNNVNYFIKEIETLQNQVNDAVVKKNTQLSKKQMILQQIQVLEKKCQDQFGCSISQLYELKVKYQNEMQEKIKNLKRVLGVEDE